ncbi:MAG TPA: hypothetical protein VIM58_03705 [Candidatus Methylacidiphilales bacterium]
MAASEKIVQLRRLLEEKHGVRSLWDAAALRTGLDCLDRLALPQGSLVEVVADPRAPGGALLLAALLKAAAPEHRLALIDGRDAFDPAGMAPGVRLLWVRCADAVQAAKAADLVVRDGNLSLAVLLLTLNPPAELRRIHANTWHRLQMLAEKSGTSLLAFTPSAQVGNAKVRLSVSGRFPLGSVEVARARLEPNLAVAVERRRVATGGSTGESDAFAVRRAVGA